MLEEDADALAAIVIQSEEAEWKAEEWVVAEWKAEEQVLLYLVLLAQHQHTMASVMRTVQRVSVVRAYYALVLMTSVARFLLPFLLLALLTGLMVLALALLACVI